MASVKPDRVLVTGYPAGDRTPDLPIAQSLPGGADCVTPGLIVTGNA